MGLDFQYEPGQTPLDEEEKEGLLIKTITTRSELDEFEQQNIEEAILWTVKNKFKGESILTEEFVCKLHPKMFEQVWRWAGDFRRSNKNIGVDKYQIGIQLRQLLDDSYWIEQNLCPLRNMHTLQAPAGKYSLLSQRKWQAFPPDGGRNDQPYIRHAGVYLERCWFNRC